MRHFMVSILLFIFCYAVSGQTKGEETKEPPFIEVTGTAELEILPDEIFIGVVLKEKLVNRVKVTISEQEEKMKVALKGIGIDIGNIFLNDADAGFVRVRWQKNEVLTIKVYTIKVSNAAEVGAVFKELDKLEITNAFISRVNHSKMDSLRKVVKVMAIKAAKEKADYLLAAIGEAPGKPLIVRENESVSGTQYANVVARGIASPNGEEDAYNFKADGSAEIQFRKLKIHTGIYVKFSIR